MNYVGSKDAHKQLARTSFNWVTLSFEAICTEVYLSVSVIFVFFFSFKL